MWVFALNAATCAEVQHKAYSPSNIQTYADPTSRYIITNYKCYETKMEGFWMVLGDPKWPEEEIGGPEPHRRALS